MKLGREHVKYVKALHEEGYEVILVNSNPATIMADPEGLVHRTYVGPMTSDLVEVIIAQEHPDAILSTIGSQTTLNLAVALVDSGALEKYDVDLIGAKLDAIKRAEDLDLFKKAMERVGLKTSLSGIEDMMEDCIEIA